MFNTFLYGDSKETVELALQQAGGELADFQHVNIAQLTAAQFRKIGAIGKLFNVVRFTRSSNARYQAFVAISGRQIPLANATRWNSWFVMLYIALELRPYVNEFINRHLIELVVDDLTRTDWLELVAFRNFLLPFWRTTKQAEGDQATLDNVLLTMDFFKAHYRQQTIRHKNNPVLNARIDHS